MGTKETFIHILVGMVELQRNQKKGLGTENSGLGERINEINWSQRELKRREIDKG